jgi:hypothetical protein
MKPAVIEEQSSFGTTATELEFVITHLQVLKLSIT